MMYVLVLATRQVNRMSFLGCDILGVDFAKPIPQNRLELKLQSKGFKNLDSKLGQIKIFPGKIRFYIFYIRCSRWSP